MDALGESTGWGPESWGIGVDEQLAALAEHGYAVVKLPKMMVDQDGYQTWPAVSSDRDACVKIRRSDGRLGMDSVSHPFASPEYAVSAAAALIAAARHAQEETDV